MALCAIIRRGSEPRPGPYANPKAYELHNGPAVSLAAREGSEEHIWSWTGRPPIPATKRQLLRLGRKSPKISTGFSPTTSDAK